MRHSLANRKVTRLMLEMGVCVLQVHGDGVMQSGLDASGLQLAADPVPLGMQDDEQVPDMSSARSLAGKLQGEVGEPFAIALGQAAAGKAEIGGMPCLKRLEWPFRQWFWRALSP